MLQIKFASFFKANNIKETRSMILLKGHDIRNIFMVKQVSFFYNISNVLLQKLNPCFINLWLSFPYPASIKDELFERGSISEISRK